MAIVRYQLCATALAPLMLGMGMASPPALAQQRVGIDSAVNPKAMGYPPGAQPRRLVLGQDIVFNERVKTEEGGQTQVLFVDESTLSVGPNANMVIDQFVYDPNAGTGKLAASLTRGVFRFVGGKLSKQDNAVTMRTPTATIGIRGGVVLASLRSDCAASIPHSGSAACNALSVYKVYGQSVTVTGLNGVAQTITRNGFEVTVSGPGASPSDPGPAPPGAAAALLTQLDGRAGGNGGAATVPTEVMVTNSGIANAISANLTASVQAAARTQPPPQQPQSVSPLVQLTQLNNQNVSVPGSTVTPTTGGPSVSIASLPTVPPGTSLAAPISTSTPTATPVATQAAATQPVITQPVITQPVITQPVITQPVITQPVITQPVITQPVITQPVITPQTPPINIASVAGGYYDTGNQGTTNGFNGSLLAYAGGSVTNSTFSANGPFGPISFPLAAGSAALNSSGTGTTSPLGPITGATYVSPDNTFFFAYLVPVNQPAQREFIYGGQPVNPSFFQGTSTSPSVLAFVVLPDAALPSVIPFLRTQSAALQASPSNLSISPLLLATPANSTFSTGTGATKALQASLAITGTGAGQASAIVVLVGNVFNASLNGTSTPQPIINGIIHGSVLTNAMGQPTRIFLPYVTPADANGNSLYGANSISGFVLSNGNCCAPGEVASKAFETNTVTQAVTQYQIAPPVIGPVAVPAAATGPQTPVQALTGYFGGIMTKEPGTGPGSPIPYTLAGTTNIVTNAGNAQVAATLNGTDALTPSTSGVTSGITLGFGSTSTGATNARIAYVNDNLFAVMENPGAASSVNGVQVPVTAGNSGANIYLVTQPVAPPPTSFLATGLCNGPCAYLQWGYWGGELDTPASGSNPARIDVGHLNFWVAGAMPTSAMDISSLAGVNMTGVYNGNLVGSVVNNGAQYLATGGLQASYNFASQTGSFTVSHYDVLPTFTASGKAPLTGSNYAFQVNSAGVTGAVNGGFYGPMAKETGGNFAFSALKGSYLTSGIFGATR
jgi:trimeric autotransporter adhesin